MLSINTEEVAQNKILLLYILKMSPNNLTNIELTEFILDKGYMNYFSLQQYLGELVDGRLIELIQNAEIKRYILLEKGEMSLDLFQNKIPVSVMQELMNEFNIQETANIRKTQVIGEFYPKKNDQFSVNLKLVEHDETLFSLYFDVSSEAQGEEICTLWKKNTESIYKSILSLFIEEKPTVG